MDRSYVRRSPPLGRIGDSPFIGVLLDLMEDRQFGPDAIAAISELRTAGMTASVNFFGLNPQLRLTKANTSFIRIRSR
jgi:hypothetical protein